MHPPRPSKFPFLQKVSLTSLAELMPHSLCSLNALCSPASTAWALTNYLKTAAWNNNDNLLSPRVYGSGTEDMACLCPTVFGASAGRLEARRTEATCWLDWGWRIPFPGGSCPWQMSWCWLLAEVSYPPRVGLSAGCLGGSGIGQLASPSMGNPKDSKVETQSLSPRGHTLALQHILFVRSKALSLANVKGEGS